MKALRIETASSSFVFTKKARTFPVVDARPYRWPTSVREADEIIEDWRARAGKSLGAKRMAKKTMMEIASHTSRRDGTCRLSDAALASRTGRSIPSVKRDISRLKKMGFAITELVQEDGYRKRRRVIHLAIPDVLDDDQRIPSNDDQRIPTDSACHWGSTYNPYVDPSEKGDRRDV